MKTQNKSTTAFGAIHTANARLLLPQSAETFRIYKTTHADKAFMQHLQETVKLNELMPQIPQAKIDIWEELFKLATDFSTFSGKTGFMITNKNTPCGLAAFTPKHLDIICTWPIETGKKVPYAGTVLMKTVFEEFLKSKNNFLKLTAVTNGPFSNVSKFTRLGFKQTGGENYTTAMQTTRDKVINVLEQLNEKIQTTTLSSPQIVDLFSL